MSKKKNQYRNKQPQQSKAEVTPKVEKGMNWTAFFLKALLFLAVVALVIFYTDQKGYFIADQRNNHIDRKWKSFYRFTETKNADVILLGNSHIVTGVEPFVLSDALGCSCFILAQSGVDIKDCWFQLGEALKLTVPKLVIVETFGLNNKEEANEDLVPITQSFEAHQDAAYKLQKMPAMLPVDAWVQAWSPTIRNHSFLLTDTARIHFNMQNPPQPQPYKLDLGRFARFPSGLTDSIIALYDSLGAAIKGDEYRLSDYAKKYLKKVMDLCEEKDIPVLFLTVPMYYKHIDNYAAWKKTLGEELQKYPKAKWLDLQQPYDTLIYTKEAFENTRSANQHLSNIGMTLTAYKLADYLQKNYQLPDRSKETVWINDFKNTDHFAYNQNVVGGMTGYVSIARDAVIGQFQIKEMYVKETEAANQLIIKIQDNPNLSNSVKAMLEIEYQNQRFVTPIDMYPFKEVMPPAHKVYTANLRKDVKVVGIKSLQ
ncbi:MAG: hypothetical protein LBN27_10015 [Prevotellaceae bacterium]|nr:hypothetical protein [Prevotellaceae bacterium]